MCSSIFTNFLINPSSLSLYLSLSLYTDFTMVPCSVWAHSCIVNVWLYAWGKRWAGVPTGWKYDWILRPGYFLSLFLFHILSLTTFRKRKKWEKYPCLQTFFFLSLMTARQTGLYITEAKAKLGHPTKQKHFSDSPGRSHGDSEYSHNGTTVIPTGGLYWDSGSVAQPLSGNHETWHPVTMEGKQDSRAQAEWMEFLEIMTCRVLYPWTQVSTY